MSVKELLTRKDKLLQMAINQYINTGYPVSSKSMCNTYGLNLSSATVRNILAELEKDGLLSHIHTSSGRVPTDKGYRKYVSNLIKIQKLTEIEKTKIKQEFNNKTRELDDIMQNTSKLLALASNHVGFTSTPKVVHENRTIDHIDLILISYRDILLIIVTDDGFIKHKIFVIDTNLNKQDVKNLAKFLNTNLKGKKISKITSLNLIHGEDVRLQILAKKIIDYIFDITTQYTLFLEGSFNIFNTETVHAQEIESLNKLFEKNMILKISNKVIENPGINVFIGKENFIEEMKNYSLITNTYKSHDKVIGVLGIIGPKRMQYSKMIPLIDFVSEIMNESI